MKLHLRNNHNALLRRVQRQVDLKKNNQEKKINLSVNSKKAKGMGSYAMNLSCYAEPENEDFEVLKNSRLGLYKKR